MHRVTPMMVRHRSLSCSEAIEDPNTTLQVVDDEEDIEKKNVFV